MGLAGAGLMAALTVGEQNAASKQQASLQEAYYRENRENAVTARNTKLASMRGNLSREMEQVAGSKMDVAIEALRRSESAKVAAGEAGIEGQTTKALAQSFDTAKLRSYTDLESQLSDMSFNYMLQSRGVDAETIDRINSVSRGVSTKANFWSAFAKNAVSLVGAKDIASGNAKGIMYGG